MYSKTAIAKDPIDEYKTGNKKDYPLKQIIENMEPEFITGGKWDIINGVKNFASLTPDEALLNAKTKMYWVSTQVNDVRCVVIDDPSRNRVIGIFSYDSILYFIK